MKTEDHQGLQTNQFGQAIQRMGHQLEEHATKIVIGICAILVVSAGVIWWSRQTSASTMAAWTLLESASTVEQYGDIVDKYKGTPAGRWAKLKESEIYLQTGMSQMFIHREASLADLKKATEGLGQLADDKVVEPTILERALWGLAVATEATSDADTGKAIAAYQRLLEAFPETFYKPVADQRVTALKTGGSKEFYGWFSKQTPKPSEARPNDGAAPDDFESMFPSPGKSEFHHDSMLKPGIIPKTDGGKAEDTTEEPADAEKPETKPDSAAAKDDAAKANDKPAKSDEQPEKKVEAEKKQE